MIVFLKSAGYQGKRVFYLDNHSGFIFQKLLIHYSTNCHEKGHGKLDVDGWTSIEGSFLSYGHLPIFLWGLLQKSLRWGILLFLMSNHISQIRVGLMIMWKRYHSFIHVIRLNLEQFNYV